MNQKITDVTATSALFAPWWWPDLHTWSSLAGEALPILGATWLILQILTRAYDFWKGGRRDEDK